LKTRCSFNSLFEMRQVLHHQGAHDVYSGFNSLFEMREGSQGERCRGAVALFQFSV